MLIVVIFKLYLSILEQYCKAPTTVVDIDAIEIKFIIITIIIIIIIIINLSEIGRLCCRTDSCKCSYMC